MDLKGQSLLEDEEERFDNQRLFPTGSITILNVHVPSNIASKHGKQKLAILKKRNTRVHDHDEIEQKDNISLSETDRSHKWNNRYGRLR